MEVLHRIGPEWSKAGKWAVLEAASLSTRGHAKGTLLTLLSDEAMFSKLSLPLALLPYISFVGHFKSHSPSTRWLNPSMSVLLLVKLFAPEGEVEDFFSAAGVTLIAGLGVLLGILVTLRSGRAHNEQLRPGFGLILSTCRDLQIDR